MKITVEIKSVYGNETIYPICDQAKIFAELLKQVTLTARDIKVIKKLGYAIEVQAPKITL
jgi:hypothetical protein